MRVVLNDKDVVIPSSLSEMTLGQRIAYHNEYGRDLDERLKKILAIKEELKRELELAEFQFEKMVTTFAFFAGVTPDVVKESKFLDEIAAIYYSALAVLFEDEESQTLDEIIVWNGERWKIDPAELSNTTKMTFGQFIDAKQIVKDLADIGAGRWESLQRLCAIYLRKENEEYDETMPYDESARLKLMESLPMNIAMQVGFFLSGTMNLFLTTSSSLESQG